MRHAALHVQSLTSCGTEWLCVAWAVEGGRAQSALNPRSGTKDEALIDAFLELSREYGTELRVYVPSAAVRTVLADAALPGLEVTSVVAGDAARLTWERARRTFGMAMAVVPRTPATLPATDVTIATDASRGHGGLAGIAYATSLGGASSATVRAANIHIAEVEAIRFALERLPRRMERVTILTDSRVAAAALRSEDPSSAYNTAHAGARCRSVVQQLRDRGVEVRIRWVRGHAGHVLNEQADRLAVHARRCGEWGLADVHAAFLQEVRSQLREQVTHEPTRADYVAVG
ncbi:ribonuclease H family protein [uncultured Corynebacterium sp.]|uniref:ribonuclease H family protein n=1 Tax=uncultured Corynebacterium sp. TaxID=159447 RepID=UPI0025DD46CF|nr:ribonuclease H family protein [uncultured Corynebacterium sp.]